MTRRGGVALEAVARKDQMARTLSPHREYLLAAVAWIETARARRCVSLRVKESCQGNLRRTWPSRERP